MRGLGVAVILILGCGSSGSKPVDAPPGGDASADAGSDACVQCGCTIATQDTSCGAHQVCDETAGQCTCAPAYKLVGGSCVFDSAPLDQGFMDPTKWSTTGPGAAVTASDPGNVDPGAGVVDRTGMCAFSSFKQTFVMPPRSKADSFKLTFRTTGIDPGFDLYSAQLSAGVGGQFGDAAVSRNAYSTTSFCLGARSYGNGAGSPVDFIAGTLGGPSCTGSSTATVKFDHLALQVAATGECPEPNTVFDGDFDVGGNGGWMFTVAQDATAEIDPAIGDGGTSAARFATANRCSAAVMAGKVAFPLLASNAHPAIELSFNGTVGAQLVLQLAGQNVSTLTGTGSNVAVHVCVPEWASGATTSLGFYMPAESDTDCTTALANVFTVDSIKLVSDASCSGAVLTDPGFESVTSATGSAPGWGLTSGHVNALISGTATIVNDPASAHGGSGVLRLGASNQCAFDRGAAAADFAFIVPPAQGTAGPALKFFANVAATNVNTVTRVTVAGGETDVAALGAYAETVRCLPPGLIGRRVFARFQLRDLDGGACAINYPEEVAFIDDVSVTTNASCPSQ